MTIRAILRQRRAEVVSEMAAAVEEAKERAAAPFKDELRDIDVAISAIEGRLDADEVSPNNIARISNVFLTGPRGVTRRLSMTLKDMIIQVLSETHGGADALQILEKINDRWSVGLARTSLSPQLSRLKAEGRINLIGKLWSIAGKNETPDGDTPGVRMEGVAGSPEGPLKPTPTGSTPVASTTNPLFPDE